MEYCGAGSVTDLVKSVCMFLANYCQDVTPHHVTNTRIFPELYHLPLIRSLGIWAGSSLIIQQYIHSVLTI